MAKKIITNFNFEEVIPTESNAQPSHTSMLELKNGLRPELFNELEKSILSIADAVGDYDFAGLHDISTAGNLGQALKDLSDRKLSKSITTSQEITSPVVFKNIQTFKGRSLLEAGSSVYGININWLEDHDYIAGDIVVAGDAIYQANENHKSVNFITDIARWSPIGGAGSTGHEVDQDEHGFQVGDIIRFDYGQSKYVFALSDIAAHVGNIIVAGVINRSKFKVITDGYIDFNKSVIIENTTLRPMFKNLEPGKWYYLNDSLTAENIAISTTPTFISQKLFLALSTYSALVVSRDPDVAADIESGSITGVDPIVLSYPPISKDYVWIYKNGQYQPKSSFSLNDNVITVPDALETDDINYVSMYSTFVNRGASFSRQRVTIVVDHNTSGKTVIPLSCNPLGLQYMFVSVDGVLQDDDPVITTQRSYSIDSTVEPNNLVFDQLLDINSRVVITIVSELYVQVPAESSITFSKLNSTLISNDTNDNLNTDKKLCTKQYVDSRIIDEDDLSSDSSTSAPTQHNINVILQSIPKMFTSTSFNNLNGLKFGDECYRSDLDRWFKWNNSSWTEI